MKIIDKDSRIPLYYQLVDIIVEEIENGRLKEDDKLFSERELCQKYDISRATVRQAFQQLEKENYIYKKHGKGTFVSPTKFRQNLLKVYSFADEMKKIGRIPSTKVIDFNIISSNEKISKKMNIEKGTRVYAIVRLRLADNIPMMIVTSYILYDRFPGITKLDLESESMYSIFTKRFNVSLEMAEETYQSVYTRKKEADLLKIKMNSPSMMIERIMYEGKQIIEYTSSISRGDRFQYHVILKK